MPSALSWKALKSVNVSTLSDVGYIAALKELFDQAKYADGSTRTGSATAWFTETLGDGSLKLTAPNNPLGLIAHFAHAALSGNVPKSFGETIYGTAGKVLGTIVLNPGAYSSNTATPWGASARCFGYCHMSPLYVTSLQPNTTQLNAAGLGANSTITAVTLKAWESADALVIHAYSVGIYPSIWVLGGWLAPDGFTPGPEDAETDGVLYGIITSGNGNAMVNMSDWNTAFHTENPGLTPFNLAPSTTTEWCSFLSNNLYLATTAYTSSQKQVSPHCAIFSPGTSTLVEVNRLGVFKVQGEYWNKYTLSSVTNVYTNWWGPFNFTTLSNKLVKFPIHFGSQTSIYGSARQIYMTNRSVGDDVIRDKNGVDIGYAVSFCTPGVSSDAILLAI